MATRFNKKEYPNVARGIKYAEDVIAGNILACKYVAGACRRTLKDLERTDADWHFDPEAAEKYMRLTQKFHHIIGHWESPNIIYEPWQCFIWTNVMGFRIRETGYRRFRIAHIEVARGNGKSSMASQAALFCMAMDNPNGNQVAAVATKKEQARIVLDASRAMADKNPGFRKAKGVEVRAHTVIQPGTNSTIRALSSEAKTLDGLNDVLAVCDELHSMDRAVFETISSGMSKRKDSLILSITTAGSDTESVGFSESAYAKKLCLGEVLDDQRFAIVYTQDEEDDLYDEKNWIKSNPNWAVSVDPVTFRAKMLKTIEVPADLNNMKIKHLNIWIAEAKAFFNKAKWDECADTNLRIEDFKNVPCKSALDLASHVDLAGRVDVFRKDDKYFIFDHTYCPEVTVRESKNDLFVNAVKTGHLISMPGEVINFKKIEDDFCEFLKSYRTEECAFDPWNAIEMSQNLSSKVEMIKFPMNVGNFSEPMKRFDALIREKKIVHNGSPLMSWCVGNVVAKEDHNGNVFPRKSHTKLKIDPVVAAIMALALWLQDKSETSIYEEAGIRRV